MSNDTHLASDALATPKTDAVAVQGFECDAASWVVYADFAREQERTLNEALDLLEAFYDAYEEGAACYEDPDEYAGYLGNAIKLEDSIDSRILALLHKHRPRDLST
jgi:hypothetical protein